jgi:hypothetical protein
VRFAYCCEDSVAQVENLFHPMRHIDDPNALVFQAADHLDEKFGLAAREGRRRLVEDHDPRVGGHGASNGDA